MQQKKKGEQREEKESTSFDDVLAADLVDGKKKKTRLPRPLSLSLSLPHHHHAPRPYLETAAKPRSSGAVLRPLESVPDPPADGAHAKGPADVVEDSVGARLALVVDRGPALLRRRGRGRGHACRRDRKSVGRAG